MGKMDTRVKIGSLDTYSRKFPSPRIGEFHNLYEAYDMPHMCNKLCSIDFDPLIPWYVNVPGGEIN